MKQVASLEIKEKGKKTLSLEIKEKGKNSLFYEIKELFIGYRTLFSIGGFTIGGILVGRSLWEYFHTEIGLALTALLGIILFAISGLILGHFRK